MLDSVDVGSNRQLFIDSYIIDEIRGVYRKLHQPVRRKVAIEPEYRWEANLTIHTQQFKDGDTYKMFYGCYGGVPYLKGINRMTALAESEDGIKWNKPHLGVIKLDGSTENNLVWKGPGTKMGIFVDQNSDPRNKDRYKAIACVGKNTVGTKHKYSQESIISMSSPDGLSWNLISEKPIFTDGPFDTHNTAFWDTTREEYIVYARSVNGNGDFGQGAFNESVRSFKDGVRWIRRSTSKDFVNWSSWEQIDCGNTPWEHLYTNACIQYERSPGIYIMFPSRFVPDRVPDPTWPHAGISDVVIMSSRDGINFDRSFMEAFIRPGLDVDNWHERSLYLNRGILQTSPDEISLFGREHSGLATVRHLRYTLRTDGFVSVKAGNSGGEFTTRPLVFTGSELNLNYSTSAIGSVKVEIQDVERKAVPGFTLKDSPELFSDVIDGKVTWKTRQTLRDLSGRPVRLRFVLKDADLYAFKFS